MDFFTLAKARCTTRGFTGESLAHEDLLYILEAAQVAPTACNRQPQRILVAQCPESLRLVKKSYNTFGAPCVLILCRDRREELVRPFDNMCSGNLDMGIVCDHMMLAARQRGIGSVMVGLFDPAIIREGFGVPQHILPTALLLLDYPNGGFLPSNRHTTTRKPLGETVLWEHWEE